MGIFDKRMDDMAQGVPGADRAAEERAAEEIRRQREETERENRERAERERAERERAEGETTKTVERETSDPSVTAADLNRREAERIRLQNERVAREQRERREREERERREREQRQNTGSSSSDAVCATQDVKLKSRTGWFASTVLKLKKGDRVTVDTKKSTDRNLWVEKDGKKGVAPAKYFKACVVAGATSTGRSLLESEASLNWKRLARKLRRAFRKVEKVPKKIVDYVEPVMFVDHQPCWRYSADTRTPDCPNGGRV